MGWSDPGCQMPLRPISLGFMRRGYHKDPRSLSAEAFFTTSHGDFATRESRKMRLLLEREGFSGLKQRFEPAQNGRPAT